VEWTRDGLHGIPSSWRFAPTSRRARCAVSDEARVVLTYANSTRPWYVVAPVAFGIMLAPVGWPQRCWAWG
jgi:hypothetical protein